MHIDLVEQDEGLVDRRGLAGHHAMQVGEMFIHQGFQRRAPSLGGACLGQLAHHGCQILVLFQ
jgi:hypothetical protein